MHQFLKKNFVKYALMMDGLVALCLLYMEVTGENQSFEKSPYISIAMMIAPLVLWYLGIKKYKETHKNHMTFKQGLSEGFRISLLFAVTSPFIFMFYYVFVNPAIVDNVKEIYKMPTNSDAQIIAFDMMVQLVSALFFGTIYAAIISYFLKTRSSEK